MAKTIIVTGASRGIGLAITRFLIGGGHNVVVAARSKDALEKIHDEAPNQVKVLAGDLTEPSIAKEAVSKALEGFGQLDGVVINHGRLEPVGRIVNADLAQWKENFDTNFFASLSFMQAAVPSLRGKGRIIITSSGAAISPYNAWGAYCTSKAALKALGEVLAVEEKDIITVSVRPGVVDTQMQQSLRDEHISLMEEKDQKKFLGLRDEGKLLQPEQPGNVIARLVLEAPASLTGQLLNWDDAVLKDFQD